MVEKEKNVKEGEGKFVVYESEKISSEMKVFYNPDMKINRDFSVGILRRYKELIGRKIKVLDGFSASGIIGIRYGLEALEEEDEIVFNDIKKEAVDLIKKNLEMNRVKQKIRIENSDIRKILCNEKFDVIDIDPFGTPAPYIDFVANSIKHKGLVLVTSTDTSPLFGTYPKTCLRKYGVPSFRTHFYRELGARILATFLIREFAKYDKAFVPVFTLSMRHFIRIAGIVKGKGTANKLLDDFKYLSYCEKCGRWYFGSKEKCVCGGKPQITGPIYMGNLWDEEFLKGLKVEEHERILNMIKEEARINTPFYYDTHLVFRKLRNIPKLDDIIKRLRELGYEASKTHFSSTGIKTDADLFGSSLFS